MNISILTLFCDLYKEFLKTSLIGRAADKKLVSFDVDTLFNFVEVGKRIDAPSYGHGAGMLIKPEVVESAVDAKEKAYGKSYKIFFSPHGKVLTQDLLKEIYIQVQGNYEHLMLLPARYEGMDARVEDCYADQIISVGNFVLMGGDLPAMVFLEGFLRLMSGVVGKQESVEKESFTGPFVDFPQYTEPLEWKGIKVPDVVRSGDHKALVSWREVQAIKRTLNGHFEWLRAHDLDEKQKKKIMENIPAHYVILMHSGIILPGDRVGNTSVTSLDIHDIARSAKTYGLKGYFIVTPLIDQQKIVKTLLDFWTSDVGKEYNEQRQKALKFVHLVSSLDEAIDIIKKQEGKEPVMIGTSAKSSGLENIITYNDQAKVWSKKSPVVFLFGTGRGLSDGLLKKCDFMLPPVGGLSDFNHLSVRSAAAIIFDRWLGINL